MAPLCFSEGAPIITAASLAVSLRDLHLLYLLPRSRSVAQLRREKIILINGEPITSDDWRDPDGSRTARRPPRHRVSVCLPLPPSVLRPSRPRHRGFDRTGEGGIARVTRRGSCEIWPTRAALRPRPSTWAGRLDMSAAVCTKRPLSERLCDKVRYLGATLKQ